MSEIERGAHGPNGPGPMTRRTLLAAVGGIVVGSVAACTGKDTSGTPTPPARSTTTSPAPTTPSVSQAPTQAPALPAQGTLYYGAFTPPTELEGFEAELGTTLACYRSFFKHWENAKLIERAGLDIAAGRVPVLSIKPPKPWAELAKDTAWLDGLMEPLAALNAPVYLAINHEPENDAHHFGTAAEYVTLQNAAIARAAMAGGQLAIVPILSSWSFDERADRTPSDWNVPEATVYGLDLYNPWSVDNGKPWVPFEDKLLLAEEEADGRPMVIGEYGCRSDPNRPGRAATWMQDAFDTAISEGVIAMAYFDSAQGAEDGTWELDAETLPVFTEILKSKDVARI